MTRACPGGSTGPSRAPLRLPAEGAALRAGPSHGLPGQALPPVTQTEGPVPRVARGPVLDVVWQKLARRWRPSKSKRMAQLVRGFGARLPVLVVNQIRMYRSYLEARSRKEALFLRGPLLQGSCPDALLKVRRGGSGLDHRGL